MTTPLKVDVPSRGQPIDAKFINDIATSLNATIDNLSARRGKTYVKPSETATDIVVRSTANASIFASTFKVTLESAQVNQSTTSTVEVKFSGNGFSEFAYLPVVTATPVMLGAADPTAKYAIATISDITKAGCNVNISFAKEGTVNSLYVQVIAVGIPV